MHSNTASCQIYSSKVASVGEVSPQTFGNIMGCGNGIMPSGHIDAAIEYLGVAYTLLAQQARMATMVQTPQATPLVQEIAHTLSI